MREGEKIPLARRLRREATDAERILWRRLRRHRLGGKFRRQHPIGPFVVDFVCLEARLVVEIDGGQHDRDADERSGSEASPVCGSARPSRVVLPSAT